MTKESAANNKRIVKNTMLLYIRMMLIMVIQLYASRVILNTLGIIDYGLYNVVGGVVTLFAFLDNAMITSTQRYITFALGAGDTKRLQLAFTTSIQIHAIISFIVFILGETVGLWLFYNKMVIPPDRLVAAMWVYQLSIAAMIVQIMSTPYNAMIIAHEKMGVFATISIIEAVLKLLILFVLVILDYDKLIVYAVLVLLAQFLVRMLYATYCKRHFPASKLIKSYNKPLVKEMSNFAGWNLFGNLAAMLYDTGLNILLNMFFGPAVNAARAISIQVESAVHRFVTGFQTAVNPQITKLYAQGQKDDLHKLIFRSSKITFFLLAVLMLPIAVSAEPILTLWLKIVPEHTVAFLRILFCVSIVTSMANPITTSAAATGNIKKYQIVLSSILLSIVPISWVTLKAGAPPITVFIVMLVICVVTFVVRLFFLRTMIGLPLMGFVRQVALPCFFVGFLSVTAALLVSFLLRGISLSWVYVSILSAFIAFLFVFFIGLSISERTFILVELKRLITRKKT